MGKLIGYIIALIGLALTILSLNLTKLNIAIPSAIKPIYATLAGVALVLIGVFLSLGKGGSSTKQASEEVPIYHGEGRHRKIVGYKRAEK